MIVIITQNLTVPHSNVHVNKNNHICLAAQTLTFTGRQLTRCRNTAQNVWLTGEETLQQTTNNKHEDKNTQCNTLSLGDTTGDVNQQISHQTSPDDYWHIVNVHLNIQMKCTFIRNVQNWTLNIGWNQAQNSCFMFHAFKIHLIFWNTVTEEKWTKV